MSCYMNVLGIACVCLVLKEGIRIQLCEFQVSQEYTEKPYLNPPKQTTKSPNLVVNSTWCLSREPEL